MEERGPFLVGVKSFYLTKTNKILTLNKKAMNTDHTQPGIAEGFLQSQHFDLTQDLKKLEKKLEEIKEKGSKNQAYIQKLKQDIKDAVSKQNVLFEEQLDLGQVITQQKAKIAQVENQIEEINKKNVQ